MKKSKFLKSSKDMMLSRSFNPAKCKTSLRLAGSRLKLLKNKKDVQVKQMRREIAQLLESGQDRTARIRVEHVIREEKMMAAYDLIEIYCELIVARLPIIESQKNCPIDLKEAITSVIFASLRCGDVPELLDVRKHFTAKYGKDFTTAAIELRPECGVGRMLVEKLSAVAPDGQTKIKILSAIAEEHNVKWDKKSFEEKDSLPPSDLLSGPSTFGRESQPAPGIQPPQSNNNSHDSPYFYQHDHKNSLGTEKLTSAQTSNVSTTFQPEASSPGGDRAQFLYQGGGQKRWNMEFKDATSAAQAAAESAEMASMAARAAAELSSGSRITRQYSTESHDSHASYISKDEGPEMYVNSKLTSKQFPEESANSSSSEIDEVKPNRVQTSGSRGKKEYNQSASVKSKSSIGGNLSDHSAPVLDGYSRKNSLEEVSKGETGMKKKSFKYTAEEKPENFIKQSGRQHSANSSRSGSIISDDVNIYSNSEDRKVVYDVGEDPFMHEEGIRGEADQPSSHVPVFDGYSRKNSLKQVSKDEMSMKKKSFKYKAEEKPENFTKQRSGKQHSANSLHSDSNISDDVNIYSSNQKGVYDVGEDPFMHKEGIHEEAVQPSSHGAPVVFDSYDSDSQLHDFDVGPTYDDHESEFHWPSSGQKSPKHLSVNTDSWSPKSSSSKIVKSTPSPFVTSDNSSFDSAEKLADGLEKDVSMPVIFDHSDGPSSESEEELKTSRRTAAGRSTNLSGKSVGSKLKGKAGASDGSRLNEKHSSGFNRKQSSVSSDDDLMPDRESGDGLVYQKLTGGLRHKGYNQPPYLNQLNTSVQKATVENTAAITSSTLENEKSVKKTDHYSESDSDSSDEEEYLQKSSGRKQELYTGRSGKEVKIKPSLRASNSVFDSDNSDLDDNPPKESFNRKSHLQGVISRRTKASPSTGKSSYTKTQLKSESTDFDDISETPKKVESPRKSSNYEQPNSAKVASKPAKSNYWGPPEPYNSAFANFEPKIHARHDSHDSYVSVGTKPSSSSRLGNSESKVDSNATNSSSRVEKPSRKTEASVISIENPKAAALKNSNKDDKKASHVHPKLPDYDSLVQTLRMNRS